MTHEAEAINTLLFMIFGVLIYIACTLEYIRRELHEINRRRNISDAPSSYENRHDPL